MKKFLPLLLALSLCAPLALHTSRAADKLDHIGTTTDASAHPVDWEITGPMGGDVRSLVVDPHDPQHLFFGTIDGQLYTSHDGAAHWSRVSSFNH
ncbi:MAG TPA: hypothetical protein VE821_04460, partial [Pyrinomonadaceae bacterium]|nr:hypothetical protein [Pyrinomonadaceae bacterium]